jgi:hypothetical protein
MRSKRPKKSEGEPKAVAEQMLGMMFQQAKAQFGSAVKSFWFYDGDLCPGCLARPTGLVKIKGIDGLPINGFMYRPRGVLIGYFLCGACAGFIFREAEKNPFKQTPLHTDMERNLIAAYHKHLSSLDA